MRILYHGRILSESSELFVRKLKQHCELLDHKSVKNICDESMELITVIISSGSESNRFSRKLIEFLKKFMKELKSDTVIAGCLIIDQVDLAEGCVYFEGPMMKTLSALRLDVSIESTTTTADDFG